MAEEKKNIPKLRFREFTGDNANAWEQRKLGEVFSILKNNTLSRANLSDEHGAAQDIHYGDILTKFNETLDISTTAVPYIQNEEVIEKTKATLLKNGDIVLADTAEDETAGKCTEIVGLVNQKVFAGLHTIPLRPNQSFSKGFLGFYMNSIAFRDQLKSLMQGIKVLSISKKALKETVISFPHDLREQEKIGQHLSNIDTLIALHQRMLDEYKTLKKTMLSKMFPKNSEKYPELRFSGFTDAWELRKLKKIIKRVRGNDGRMTLPTLTISAANGWMDQVTRFSSNIAGKEQKNYTLLKKGQLSYNHGNSKLAKYGAVFELREYEEALVPRVYHSFEVSDGSPAFIEYMFLTKLPDRELRKLVSSGARMDGLLNINYDDFSNINIKTPTVAEEVQIAYFLRKLDKLITLHQRNEKFSS